jgi:ATP-dependent helicase/nuclease subunit A
MIGNKWTLPHIVTVRSSAGSGKTYNLALRYLQLLVIDEIAGLPARSGVSNIVAITFTNKAAAEMRSRIIDWMKRIILDLPFESSTGKPLDELLTAAKSGDRDLSRTAIKEAISRNFEGMLRDFYDFKVSTIDSFVNLTLKASAFKLNLPPDFDISTDSAAYIDIVLQECLLKILEDDSVRRKFDRFLKNYIEMEGERVSWVPKNFLRETITSFWREETKENKGFTSIAHMAGLEVTRKEIQCQVSDLLAYLKSTERVKAEKRFLDALENLSSSDRFDFTGSACFKREHLHMSLLKASIDPEQEYEDLWKELRKSLSTFVETVSELKFASYVEIYGLFKQSLEKEVTYQRRVVLIEQLNALLQRIIEDENFVPEIYYALAERYLHFLVDEFQDTNYLQWKNIEILAEEALARGGTLFLVGDKKQSIYRWRGGKPELVDEITSQRRSYPIYEVFLDRNFRSSGHIVRFNNMVFDRNNLGTLVQAVINGSPVESREKIPSTYDRSAQMPLDSKVGEGYVYVEKIVQDSEDGTSKERFNKDEKQGVIKERCSTLIREIRNRGTFRDSDITILVRRREEAQFIVKLLLEMDISVDSEFTVNVKNNPLVKELVAFLNFTNSPDDDLSFAGFLTGSIFSRRTGLDGKEIFQWITAMKIHHAGHLYKAFQRDYGAVWNDHFDHLFNSAGYLPLYEFVALFLKTWEVLQNFPEDTPFFLHLCDLIKDRESLGASNLHQFLRFWNSGGDSFTSETQETEKPFLLKTVEGTDAVKVMTVHKAKGLQSPVVILPFLKLTAYEVSDSRDKTKFFVEDERDMKLLYIKKSFIDFSENLAAIYHRRQVEFLLDELNNTYVACTRPEKELYILLTDSKRQKNQLIDYLFGMEELKPFIKGNVIALGSPFGKPKTEEESIIPQSEMNYPAASQGVLKARQQEDTVGASSGVWTRGAIYNPKSQGQPAFEDFGHQIRWMDNIKGKLGEPARISAEQIFAKRKGDVVHYILSLVKRLPEESPEEFVARCTTAGVARFGFDSHRKEIEETIAAFFLNPRFREFFLPAPDSVVFTEREIVDGHGETFKIDRIAVMDDHIDVVDFKTGETQSRAHIDQISLYARLVREIYPGKPVRTFLLYVDDGTVKDVS